VQKLYYKSYAKPFVRVVCGIPTSWDTNTASTTRSSEIELVAWSPCNRFIAITLKDTWVVDVLDSVTLQHVQTLESPQNISTKGRALVFSPDGYILTCSSGGGKGPLGQELAVISWDLQTGGVAGIIRHQGPEWHRIRIHSLSYSADGKVVGHSCQYDNGASTITHMSIFIFDVASGIHIYTHSLNTRTAFLDNIWAHKESLRFATADWTAITIWEIKFTLDATPAKVETIPIPYHFGGPVARLLPTSYRLAAILKDRIWAWDAWESKCLLNYTDDMFSTNISFSPDGHFLACSTFRSEVYLWKESPTGYILQEKLAPTVNYSTSCFSQDGKSLVTWRDHAIQLWHTESSVTHPSTHIPKCIYHFFLDFSPNGTVVLVAMRGDNLVTVLDLKTGVPQLTIDAGMRVHGLKVVGSRVFVMDERSVVVWNLPTGDFVPNSRASLKDSLWAEKFNHVNLGWMSSISISPDSKIIGFVGGLSPECLYTYNLSTGKRLKYGEVRGSTLWFSPDGYTIWCAQDDGEAEVWEAEMVPTHSEHTRLTVSIKNPPEGYPWGSSCGYQVTNDWWILGPDEKRLLMLPPHWRSHEVHRMWKGQLLALLHCGLPEAVILELDL